VAVTGTQRRLPPAVDQAAHRIVQEALTNVARHAGQACASVCISYGPAALTVQVDDDGQGAQADPPAPGLGLTGMRNGLGRSAATFRPARGTAGASGCTPNCRCGCRRDQGPARR